MATLKALKKEINAGALVEQDTSVTGLGYTCIEKIGRYYYYTYENTEHEVHDTWDKLYESAEPDSEAFPEDDKYFDSWRVAVPAKIRRMTTLNLSDEEYEAIEHLKKHWGVKTTSEVIRRAIREQVMFLSV